MAKKASRWRLLIGVANALVIMAMVGVLLVAMLRTCAAHEFCVMGAAGGQIVHMTRRAPLSDIAVIVAVLFLLCVARWILHLRKAETNGH
jgi:hypothetical protein